MVALSSFPTHTGDQYVQKKPQLVQRKNGDIVIIDSKRTLTFIYNLYYWLVNSSLRLHLSLIST
jgi:proton-dependent oligopeptide transporter, POT family